MQTPDDVLSFWFGEPATDAATVMAKVALWFRGGPAMDEKIQAQFGALVRAALAGELDAWAGEPRSHLAFVIVLDQFTRNVLRNDPKTYAGDAKAQRLAIDALDRKLDAGFDFPERAFLCMPLVHAEDLPLQRRALAYARDIAKSAPTIYAKMASMQVDQATKYEGIIARFGRFPHRNAILGRESTPEELEFLAHWEQHP